MYVFVTLLLQNIFFIGHIFAYMAHWLDLVVVFTLVLKLSLRKVRLSLVKGFKPAPLS